jgi:hypothetical protein
MTDPNELADRYVAIWNEPDPERRRAAVRELWSDRGVQLLKPPQEIRAVAATLDMTPVLEARGHAALEARVTRAYDEFVAPGTLVFRSCDDADRVQDVVKFRWEAVTPGGEPQGGGLQVLMLDPDGRIRLDYQFIE